MVIRDVELDLDIYDADAAQRVEEAMASVMGLGERTQGLNMADSIRLQCRTVMDCFNRIFGEGTDRRLFGDRVNLLECLDAFETLAAEVDRQREILALRLAKYSAGRGQR